MLQRHGVTRDLLWTSLRIRVLGMLHTVVDIQIQGPKARISKNRCSLEKKKGFNLVFHFFLSKSWSSLKNGLHFDFVSDFTIVPAKSWWSLKKKTSLRFRLRFYYFSPKIMVVSKKKSLYRIDLVLPTFCPNFMMVSKKHLQLTETICAIFKGGPRQLPHSPHPISTTCYIKAIKVLLARNKWLVDSCGGQTYT